MIQRINMKQTIASAVIALAILLTAVNVPAYWLSFNHWFGGDNLGATVTNLTGTENLTDFPTSYNLNINNINTDLEATIATTSMTGLVGVGTLTTGTWNATAIGVGYGGTGTTSPSLYNVMLGDGANGLTTASSTGTNGQFLTSGGASAYPSWTTAAIDESGDYTWTGHNIFSSLFATNATSTYATTTTKLSVTSGLLGLNGSLYQFPALQPASSTVPHVDAAGNVSFMQTSGYPIAQSGTDLTTSNTSSTTLQTIVIPPNFFNSGQFIELDVITSGTGTGGKCQFAIQFGNGSATSTLLGWQGNGANCGAGDDDVVSFQIQADGSSSAQITSFQHFTPDALISAEQIQTSISITGNAYIELLGRTNDGGDTARFKRYSARLTY